MKVAVIGPNQIFGHEDVLFQRDYTTTAKCISNNAIYYMCKAEQFRNLIQKDDKIFDILSNISLAKNQNLKQNIRKAAKSNFKEQSSTKLELYSTKPQQAPINQHSREILNQSVQVPQSCNQQSQTSTIFSSPLGLSTTKTFERSNVNMLRMSLGTNDQKLIPSSTQNSNLNLFKDQSLGQSMMRRNSISNTGVMKKTVEIDISKLNSKISSFNTKQPFLMSNQ